jgi:hypothetical protein
MPTFPKPKFAYTYNVQTEVAALRQHKATPDRLIEPLPGRGAIG